MCMILVRPILEAVIEIRITIDATCWAPTKSIEHKNAQVQMHNPSTSRARVQLTKWPQSHCTQTEGRWDNPSGPWRRASPVWRRSRKRKLVKLSYISHAMLRKKKKHIEQGFSLAVTTSISFPGILVHDHSVSFIFSRDHACLARSSFCTVGTKHNTSFGVHKNRKQDSTAARTMRRPMTHEGKGVQTMPFNITACLMQNVCG